ncbi:MAG: 16S rRNA (cytosine(967)-C(5))-methyltransferase RsmB [Chthoniobacterales bacterium]|nr:16S rRNA (cytosine(967)-C(5))-methyltransferase RsmB [Chthoniobacterales bacterium]
MSVQQSARGIAWAALSEWQRSRHFADAIIQNLLAAHPVGSSDRGFAIELFYGVLRNLTLLDFWIGQLRAGSLDHGSRDLLRLGLYQLLCLRTASHAAVFETVALSGRRQRPLINAVLRAALRRFDELQTATETQPLATRFSHPDFLIQRWSELYGPEAAEQLCAWNNQPAPVYARINQLRTTRAEFLAGHPTAHPLPEKPDFVRLERPPVEALARGDCYVQDPSTVLACQLLDPQPDETVLDACAAPGGKSGYLAELMRNRGNLIACDRDPSRLETLQHNLQRLDATCATTIRQDWAANEPFFELHLGAFDRILLDAPCTNTGVMRRRVDLRWRLRPDDFARMPIEQLAILRRLAPLLKAGGVLVYSTCSIEPEENQAVVKRALKEFPFLTLIEEKSVLPFRDHFDGAFAAKLIRTS